MNGIFKKIHTRFPILSERAFLTLLAGQFVSQLGSAMTEYALILWTYSRTGAVLSLALMAVCSYLPGGLAAIWAGSFVDAHDKRRVMLVCDSLSACVSLAILILWELNRLKVAHLYVLNALLGLLGAFQTPASSVAVTRLLPRESYAQAGAAQSLTGAVRSILTPALAATIMALGGLRAVVLVDLGTFAAAFFTLLRMRIPDSPMRGTEGSALSQLSAAVREGARFVRARVGLMQLLMYMGMVNLFAAIAYYNTLPAMVISRSGLDWAYGAVSSAVGVGTLIGGVLAGLASNTHKRVRLLCLATGASFLMGDVLLGLGRSLPWWIAAVFISNLPIPTIDAQLFTLLRLNVPAEMQGRVFALKSATDQLCMPVGYLIGGVLADYALEPLMRGDTALCRVLEPLVGAGPGAGMAVIFLITGVTGALMSLMAYRRGHMNELKQDA